MLSGTFCVRIICGLLQYFESLGEARTRDIAISETRRVSSTAAATHFAKNLHLLLFVVIELPLLAHILIKVRTVRACVRVQFPEIVFQCLSMHFAKRRACCFCFCCYLLPIVHMSMCDTSECCLLLLLPRAPRTDGYFLQQHTLLTC